MRCLRVLDAAPLEGHALVDGVGYAMLKGVPEGPKFIGRGGCALVQGAADGPSPIDGVGCVLAEGSTFIYLAHAHVLVLVDGVDYSSCSQLYYGTLEYLLY